MRREPTPAEAVLWQILRDRRVQGVKFRRQCPIGPYIADFASKTIRLVIEADGAQHVERRVYDQSRTLWLEAEGWEVIRFWNPDILNRTDEVGIAIAQAVLRRMSDLGV